MNEYFMWGPSRTWEDELRLFCRLNVKYTGKEGCEECEALRSQDCSVQPSLSSSGSVNDAIPTAEVTKDEKQKARFGFLELGRHKRRRRITECSRIAECPSCLWASYFPLPLSWTISDESTKFPFLLVVKPGEEACFLKNLVLPVQVELKHRMIRPHCEDYLSIYSEVKWVPHCCFYFRCFYSRDSWMLLYQRYPACCDEGLVLVLLNPLTNTRIDLPVPRLSIKDAAFSVSATTDTNTSPDCVIAVGFKGDTSLCVAMWRPGWKTWEIHEGEYIDLHVDSYLGMVFCGKRVRCFARHGWMHVFDMNGDQGSWGISRVVHDPDVDVNRSQFHERRTVGDTGIILATSAGGCGSLNFSLGRESSEVLKILSWPDDAGKWSYRFYRLDRLELEWVRLDKQEWIDRSWFFNDEYVFSTATIGGAKMFRKSYAPAGRYSVKIICDDLQKNFSHSLVGDFPPGSSWVYLGC